MSAQPCGLKLQLSDDDPNDDGLEDDDHDDGYDADDGRCWFLFVSIFWSEDRTNNLILFVLLRKHTAFER